MPTAAELRKAIAKQSGHPVSKITQMTKGLSVADLQAVLSGARQASAQAAAAAQAAAQVARQGGTMAQAKVAGQAAAQAVQAQAMGGTRPAGGGAKSSSSRTPGSPGRKSASTDRQLSKSSKTSKPVTVSKTKGGGRGRDPSKAKNMEVLRQGLRRLGVSEDRLKGKNRPALEQMMRYEYQKGKSTRGGGTGKKSSLPKSYSRDYARVRALLKDGKISPRMRAGKQVMGVEDIPLSDTKARYEAFFQTYRPAVKQAKLLVGPGKLGAAPKSRKSKSKSGGGGRKSVAKRFAAIKQQGKVPYYLAKGSVRRIGGGPGGPGVVRVIPGSKATPFNQLSEAEKRRVLSYLNSDNGKSLRGPGAKRKVDVQGVIKLRANEKAARQAARAKSKSKSGRKAS